VVEQVEVDLKRWWVLLNWVLESEWVRGKSTISENKTGRLEKQSAKQSRESEEAINYIYNEGNATNPKKNFQNLVSKRCIIISCDLSF
jgi:hypothetical protein